MSEIRKAIQDINNPAVHNRRSFTTIGKVTKINEKNNTCSIQYVNNDGYYSNKDNVHIRLFMPGFIGWFPKIDDFVHVEITERYIMITGPAEDNYGMKTRGKIQTKKEILASNYGGTLSGSIF